MLSALIQKSQRPLIVAHRGCPTHENTIVGFQRGVEKGCRVLECDIRLSKDDTPVVIHDTSIRRTCQGIGRGTGRVQHMTANQLADRGVPSFETLANWMSDRPDLCLLVEIKDEGTRKNAIMVERTADILRRYSIQKQCTVISFRRSVIVHAKMVLPDVKTGLIYGPLYMSCPFRRCAETNADYLVLHHALLYLMNTRAVEFGLPPVLTWTVNTAFDATQTAGYPVAGIITDYPEMVGKVCDQGVCDEQHVIANIMTSG